MPEAPEQTATSNDPKHQVRDDPRFSPGAGCFIFGLGSALFLGILVFAITFGVRMDRDIAAFAEDEAMELPDEPGTPEEVMEVRSKLEEFKKAIRASQPATLELTPKDINILVHNETALLENRDMVYFDEFSPAGITGRIAMPLKQLAFWKPNRYLNGTFKMELEASPGKLFLRLRAVESPGKEIPPGFVERISQDDLLSPFKVEENEDIFATIQSATTGDGIVTIESKPLED